MKAICVSSYDPSWPTFFQKEAEALALALKKEVKEIHHIGSTAVEGLCAKPTLDLLAVVENPEKTIPFLEDIGYQYRGEWNVPLKYGFRKRQTGGAQLDVNLHVYEEGHPEIELNILFREALRQHPEDKEAYAQLKKSLVACPNASEKEASLFSNYTVGKYDFIQHILRKEGYSKERFLYVSHPREWRAYHRIRQKELFKSIGIAYDPMHPSVKSPDYRHFVFYKGTEIIGVAAIELLPEKACILRPFAIDGPYQNRGYGSLFLTMLEEWMRKNHKENVFLHANPKAFSFYQRLGYQPMSFEDPHPQINPHVIDMGKRLT